MCYIQVKNIRLNSFYEEKKIKLCLTKQLLNMFKLWCEWGISYIQMMSYASKFCNKILPLIIKKKNLNRNFSIYRLQC